jgi:quinol monooxygenase YgiN
MTPEIIRDKIAPERKASFEQAYAAAAQVLQQSEYCIGYQLLVSDVDPTLYLLRIDWTSPDDHLKGFRGSALFRQFFERVKPFVDDILEMTHYRSTPIFWQRY